MAFQVVRCPYCGSEGHLKETNGVWFCEYCGNHCTDDTAKNAYDSVIAGIGAQMKGAVDEALLRSREEQYYNLRSLLWEKIYAKFTDSAAIVDICRDIKKLEPHDFLASFFELANSGVPADISKAINDISVEENAMFVDTVFDFMLKSLNSEYVMPLGYLIERAYKKTDLRKFEECSTRLESEAEKADSGIYSTMIPRDVFIAYSSKDIDKVIELMNLLEENGLSCFVAMRNLQHGRGAVANYREALRSAIDNSKTVVFVSSKNSRSFNCDALKEELGYIRETEQKSAPLEFRNDYVNLPIKYKKPRIEYRLDDTPTPVDRFVREFFSNLDYCESPEKVLARLVDYNFYGMSSKDSSAEPVKEAVPAPKAKPVVPKIERKQKYCVACKAANDEKTKFCTACGVSEFALEKSELDKLFAEYTARMEAERKLREQSERNAREEMERKLREELAKKAAAESENKPSVQAKTEQSAPETDFVIENKVLIKYTGSSADVVVPDGVIAIGDKAFYGCRFIKSIVVPDSVEKFGYSVFGDCISLESLTVPFIGTEIDLPSKEFLGYLFGAKSALDNHAYVPLTLTSVSITNSVSLSGVCFDNCRGITKINLPESLAVIPPASFLGCTSLSYIGVDEKNMDYKSINGSLYTKDGKKLVRYAIGKKSTHFNIESTVEVVLPHAVAGAINLTNLSIPSGVVSIGSNAFKDCSAVLDVTIPESVKFVESGAFSGVRAVKCKAKKSLFGLSKGWKKDWCDPDTKVSWGV